VIGSIDFGRQIFCRLFLDAGNPIRARATSYQNGVLWNPTGQRRQIALDFEPVVGRDQGVEPTAGVPIDVLYLGATRVSPFAAYGL
jgi:hypothetical protein